MGPEGAVEILYGKQLQQAAGDREKLKETRVAEFREKLANPYVAAERGYIDEVIEPSHTRPKLIRALEMCANKRDTNPPRKHGNIPL
jgi:propionyl-CoA carboxylase beta chain